MRALINSAESRGNSSLGLHSADFANLGRFADFSPVSHPKFAKNHESQTENPSVVDSALAQNLGKNISSLRDSAKQNRGKPPCEKNTELQGGLPRTINCARNDKNYLDSASSTNETNSSIVDEFLGLCEASDEDRTQGSSRKRADALPKKSPQDEFELKYFASLKSIASFIPPKCVSNDDFAKTLDTSDEWITKRTGIKTRFFADENQKSSDLGFEASKIALQRANISASEVDAVICATLSGDYFAMPSTATIIAHKLGIENKPAFDISAACSGFIYLLSIAKSYIESGIYRNILVVGAEKVSSVLDFSDRNTCVLFGDGAGAAIVGRTSEVKKSILDVSISASGKYANLLHTPRGSALQMKGNEIFKLAVRTLTNCVSEILQKNNLGVDDIDFFIPHQANLRIINAVGDALKFDASKVILTVQKYGNTSAASIPMAIDEIYNDGRLKNGDLLLLDAFGGGLTWGSALVYFNGE